MLNESIPLVREENQKFKRRCCAKSAISLGSDTAFFPPVSNDLIKFYQILDESSIKGQSFIKITMSNPNADKVGEIFLAGGAAFHKMSELIMSLHSVGDASPSSGKWSLQEIQMLQSSVKTFNNELKRIHKSIKSNSSGQAEAQVKEPVGIIGLKKTTTGVVKNISEDKMRTLTTGISQSPPKPHLTLNMLNAVEAEVDVEGLSNKLDYDSTDAP